MKSNETIEQVNEISEYENGGHGYIEHASIGNKIVHVFYADENTMTWETKGLGK